MLALLLSLSLCGQGLFASHALIQPSVVGRFSDVEVAQPVTQELGFSVDRDANDSAPVPALSLTVSPSAVPRLIVAVPVDAVQCKSGRLRSHVCKERSEVIPPSFAHLDTTPTVESVGMIGRIEATIFSTGPDVVLGGSRSSVDESTLAGKSSSFASTAFRATASDSVAMYGYSVTAIALTEPERIFDESFFTSCPAHNVQATKLLTGHVYGCHV